MAKVETTNANPQRKKITAKIFKTADMKVGGSISGIFQDLTERPWFDQKNGEEKMIPQLNFTTKDGERFALFGDAGLKNAIQTANVQKGMEIEIEKLDQVDIGSGHRVNNYEIYALN